ncbi:MAG: PadR family transcriptional regulator [Ktedonobacteraceae bacterium]|nr:PadR family transcriptional regulator [Ktedonobacteraceae bacterium]
MSQIRLLILGVLHYKQPRHGYDIRRELELWGADQWTNIAYGSIYSALKTMTEDGLIEVVPPEQPRGKAVARTLYELTPKGRGEFERLLREYWWNLKPVIDPFQVAVAFMDCMPREELLAALRYRAELLRAQLGSIDFLIQGKLSAPGTGRHIAENIHLMAAHAASELHWIEDVMPKIERGELP